jgi:hypothetical protein
MVHTLWLAVVRDPNVSLLMIRHPCPTELQINNWDEQRANGVFLGVQEKAAEAHGDHHH